MIIQDRDIEIIKWINSYGFATAGQIQRKMSVGESTAYIRIKKLVDGGYLARERILHGSARVHKPTNKAIRLACDDLPPVKQISLPSYKHDQALTDLALSLERQHRGVFTPERRIRHALGENSIGRAGRIPDGIFESDSHHKPIAIELELSVKSKQRLKNIFNSYMSNLDYAQVWYFTDQQTVRNALLRSLPKNQSVIEVHTLNPTPDHKENDHGSI